MKVKRFDENFYKKLKGISFNTIEESKDSIYALSKDFEIIYFNDAWMKFAESNCGEPIISSKFPIGTSIDKAICGSLKEFYLENFKRVLKDQKVWNHEYECSSIDLYRVFIQQVLPLKNGEGLIIISSLKIETPKQNFNSKKAILKNYMQETGFINQCSNCRRTQKVNEPNSWDWVPFFVEKPSKQISHTICTICFDYYWKFL